MGTTKTKAFLAFRLISPQKTAGRTFALPKKLDLMLRKICSLNSLQDPSSKSRINTGIGVWMAHPFLFVLVISAMDRLVTRLDVMLPYQDVSSNKFLTSITVNSLQSAVLLSRTIKNASIYQRCDSGMPRRICCLQMTCCSKRWKNCSNERIPKNM